MKGGGPNFFFMTVIAEASIVVQEQISMSVLPLKRNGILLQFLYLGGGEIVLEPGLFATAQLFMLYIFCLSVCISVFNTGEEILEAP